MTAPHPPFPRPLDDPAWDVFRTGPWSASADDFCKSQFNQQTVYALASRLRDAVETLEYLGEGGDADDTCSCGACRAARCLARIGKVPE